MPRPRLGLGRGSLRQLDLLQKQRGEGCQRGWSRLRWGSCGGKSAGARHAVDKCGRRRAGARGPCTAAALPGWHAARGASVRSSWPTPTARLLRAGTVGMQAPPGCSCAGIVRVSQFARRRVRVAAGLGVCHLCCAPPASATALGAWAGCFCGSAYRSCCVAAEKGTLQD